MQRLSLNGGLGPRFGTWGQARPWWGVVEGTPTVGPREPVPLGSAGKRGDTGWVKWWGLRRDVSGTRPEAAGGRGERRAGGRGPGAAAWGGGEIAPAGASGGGPGGTGAWTGRGLRPPCSHGPREAGVGASRAPQIGHLPSARRTRRAKPRALRARGRALGAGRPPQRQGLRCAEPVTRSRRRGPRAAAPLVRRIRAPTHIHDMSRGLGWSRRTCWAPRPAPRPTPGCSLAPCVSPQQGFDRNMLGALAGANSLRNFTSRF